MKDIQKVLTQIFAEQGQKARNKSVFQNQKITFTDEQNESNDTAMLISNGLPKSATLTTINSFIDTSGILQFEGDDDRYD